MAHEKGINPIDSGDIFENESDEGDVIIKPYEVDCLPNDYNIATLMSFISRGFLKIPSFQRNYVWKLDMASKFIESIIIGLPIPQVFFFEQARNNFLVIDGQQRMITIYLFTKKRFPKNDIGRAIIRSYLSNGKEIPDSELSGENFEPFMLKLPITDDENVALNKKNYDTLPSTPSFDFKGSFDFDRTIRTITIKQNQPDDNNSSMYEIFSRLNSGGVTLKPQEIRVSLFYSKFYDKISELNLNEQWRKFLGKPIPDLHMNDVEVIVRAFAMMEVGKNYKAPMRVFLNKFSGIAKEYDDAKIDSLVNLFNEFWLCCESLDKDSFKNENNKFVISLFESVFVAACDEIRSNGLNGKKIVPESLAKLKEDPEFSDASTHRTADAKRVRIRISKAKEHIVLK